MPPPFARRQTPDARRQTNEPGMAQQKRAAATTLLLLLIVMTANAQSQDPNHHFLRSDGTLQSDIEFRDGQAGYAGVSGTSWLFHTDGSLQSRRFINAEISTNQHVYPLNPQEIKQLGKTLSEQGFSSLPATIPSAATLNPHRLMIRVGKRSATLDLSTSQSIKQALQAKEQPGDETRHRFLTIAQKIEDIIAAYSGR